jgi:hypothetical protein
MSDLQFERAVTDWLEDGSDRTPRRAIDGVLLAVKTTPQERDLRIPWRFPPMPALTRATGIAAVALVATVAAGGVLYTGFGGPGASPTPTIGPTPTSPPPTPTAAATPKPVGDGLLSPGNYAETLSATDAGVKVNFTLTEPWEWFGSSLFPVSSGPGLPGGLVIQFLDITSLNPDPCHWRGTDGDIDAGTTVAHLVAALAAQTAYAVSDPVNVTIGGYSGQRVDITGPTEPYTSRTDAGAAPDCDDEVVRLWNTAEHGESGIHLQGPANRWQANILDIDGTRLVVVAQDFPGTTPADRARLDAVIESLVIEP